MENKRGITLVALVITIIIMIILAGISINAIVGDNGILNQSRNAKIRSEDAKQKEALNIAWNARLTKFYEDLSSGKTTLEQMHTYFTAEELNKELANNGRITSIEYNATEKEFDIKYESDTGVNYTGKIKLSGEIVSFVRGESNITSPSETAVVTELETKEYTEVWVSYYEDSKTLAYSSSSDVKIENQEPTTQWDFTDVTIISAADVPWYTFYSWDPESATNTIENVIVLDEIVPKSAKSLFSYINASNYSGLEKVLNNINSIQRSMFEDSGITSITIPNNIQTIEKEAFYSCRNLTNITIQGDITSVGDRAFSGCNALTNITLSEGLTTIGEGAFGWCNSMTSMVIPSSVTSIGKYAFEECDKLESINIPDGITRIEESTFSGCRSLTSIDIPDSVTYLGGNAFSGCPITSLTLPSGIITLEHHALASTDITSMVIPDGTTSIGWGMFWFCQKLETVTIPDSVTSIEKDAFNNCMKLKEITIPAGVTSIGDGAFNYCSELTSITIPNAVTSIGDEAFWHCDKLETIEISSSVTSIGEDVFKYCTSLETITIHKPEGSIEGAGWGAPEGVEIIWDT